MNYAIRYLIHRLRLKCISKAKKNKLQFLSFENGIFNFQNSSVDSDLARSLVHIYATKYSEFKRPFYPIGWYCLDPKLHTPKMIHYQWDSELFKKTFDLSIGMGPAFTSEYTAIPIKGDSLKDEFEKRHKCIDNKKLPITKIEKIDQISEIFSELGTDFRMRKGISTTDKDIDRKILQKFESAGIAIQHNAVVELTEQGMFLINEIDEYIMNMSM